jgi:hypothetical protein
VIKVKINESSIFPPAKIKSSSGVSNLGSFAPLLALDEELFAFLPVDEEEHERRRGEGRK